MQDYIILTDSTADLPKELVDELDIQVEPMTYIIDGKEYSDKPLEDDVAIRDFYRLLREGKQSTTSQVNQLRFEDIFDAILKQGQDLLYIAFSSALSGTAEQATHAAEALQPKYPDRKIIVVDSLCASLGEGMMVYYAANMRKEGKSIDEVAEFVRSQRLHLCHWFTVDDLNHLKRGGRVSPTAALVGTMLGIKPILHVDNEGRLIPVSKVRGRRKSLDDLVERARQTIIDPEQQTVFISHGDCEQDALYIKQQVMEKIGVKQIYINYIGPVIGSHSGQGTVALFFFGSKR